MVLFVHKNPISPSVLPCLKKNKNKTKLLNPTESSRQVQFPSLTPPDMEMVTFTPTLHSSPPPQVWEFFIFTLLHRLTPKPPCFPLKTFLFALYISALSPFAPCFSICLFSHPFYFIFSLPPFFCISRFILLPFSLSLFLPLSLSLSVLALLR